MSSAEELPRWQQFKIDSQRETPIGLEVKGRIPDWVEGSLYRNGAGLYSIGGKTVQHLFDGMAVLQRFSIKNGQVKFQSKILDSNSWEKSYKANRLVVNEFGTTSYPDPCKSIFSRIVSWFLPKDEDTDNTSVNIVERGDELWAMTEVTKINKVAKETLSKIDQKDVKKYVAVHMATAHPHLAKDGTMYNLATCFNHAKAYSIIQIPPISKDNGNLDFDKTELVGSVPSRWKTVISYNHSFGMSENYFILLEQPYAFNVIKLLLMNITGSSFNECMSSYYGEKTILHVMDKSGKRLNAKYVTNPYFIFHFCNCYEKDGQLVVDLVLYKDINFVNDLYLKSLRGDYLNSQQDKPLFARFVLPLDISKAEVNKNLVTLENTSATAVLQSDGSIFCSPDFITEDGIKIELPTFNYNNYNTKEYRYAYGAKIFSGNNEVIKIDLKERTQKMYNPGGNMKSFASEPIFLPKPGSTKEDEGVILTPIIADKAGVSSYLLVLDAETMEEVARAILPEDVIMTLTFHGTFSKI